MSYRLLIFCLLPFYLELVGCDSSHNKHGKKSDAWSNLTILSPTNSMAYGRESAVNRRLAQVWLISHINDMPLHTPYYLDFRQFLTDKTILSSEGCPDIAIRFDTSEINNSILTLSEINRDISHCSNTIEDALMGALSDIRYFECHNVDNTLSLISYQDKLTLSPIQKL